MTKIDKQKLYSTIVEFLKSKGATKVAVFGSYARDEETPKSDIDVVVKFKETLSLLDFVRIERLLSKHIGKKVDLLTEKNISPYLLGTIKKQMKVLYQ